MAQKKPFFLKRWLDSLYNSMFNVNLPQDSHDKPQSPIWITLLIALAAGFVAGMANLMTKGDAEEAWMLGAAIVALLAAVAFTTLNLVKTQKYVQEKGKKVSRAIFMFLIDIVLAVAGFILGYYLVILVIILFVLWIVIKVAFPSNKGTNKIRLDDGTILTVRYGPTGEELLCGNDGCTYQRNPDGSFSKV